MESKLGGVRWVPLTAKPHNISAKTAKPHRRIAKNRNNRILSNAALISLFLSKKSYVDSKKQEMEGISAVSAFFLSLYKLLECLETVKTAKPQFKMAKNRKTAQDFGGKTQTASYY